MNTDELIAAMAATNPGKYIPEPDTWAYYQDQIRKSSLTDDPRRFTKWPVIQQTMFADNPYYAKLEWDELAKSDNPDRWVEPIREYDFGDPTRLSFAPLSSGSMVHNAHYVMVLEKYLNIQVQDLKVITDFGAGYGATCSVIRRLGFTGRYVAYDTIELNLLMEYYLSNIDRNSNVRIFADIKNVDKQGRFAVPPANTDLLIATYSLSEVSEDLRWAFFGAVRPKYTFIAHQEQYGKDNMRDVFDNFCSRLARSYNWQVVENPFISGHRYIFGKRID